MGADRPVVGVGADDDVETGALQAEREPSGSAEEVDGGRSPPVSHEAVHGRQVGRFGALRVACRSGR